MQAALRGAVAGTTGHVVLTVAGTGTDWPAGGAVLGGVAVLVADRPDAVAGHDAVVADPGRVVAARYGFEHAAGRSSGRTATSAWSVPSPMSTDTSPS